MCSSRVTELRIGKRKGIYDIIDVLKEYKSAFNGNLDFLYGGDGDIEQVDNIIKKEKLDNIAKYQG